MQRKIAHQRDEEPEFEFLQPRLGAEDFAFQLLERGGSEAFRADQRLLAFVVRRHAVEVGFGDLDVVAEDLVVADFQRGDVAALALGRFQPRDHAARVGGERAQLVNFGTEAAPNHVAIARIDRRLVADRRVDTLG